MNRHFKLTSAKRRWLWVLLFLVLVAFFSSSVFSWNVIVRTLGFAFTLGVMGLFLAKLLREMTLNAWQSEFLATVTHELKTPIAAIELTANLLRSEEVSEEEKQKLWESHDQEVQRLRLDVEALLEAARTQTRGKRRSANKRSTVALEPWLDQSMSRWRRILGPQAVIRREGTPLPSTTPVDVRALDLITDNILDNARKYSKEFPEVTIVTERLKSARIFSKPRWRIRFVDQGWGFDPRDSKKIFDRFFRSRMDRADSIPGTGLGLFIALSAGRSAGLKLEGKSAGHGRGAVFTVEGKESSA
jgi:signal transduction histidine kinase